VKKSERDRERAIVNYLTRHNTSNTTHHN